MSGSHKHKSSSRDHVHRGRRHNKRSTKTSSYIPSLSPVRSLSSFSKSPSPWHGSPTPQPRNSKPSYDESKENDVVLQTTDNNTGRRVKHRYNNTVQEKSKKFDETALECHVIVISLAEATKRGMRFTSQRGGFMMHRGGQTQQEFNQSIEKRMEMEDKEQYYAQLRNLPQTDSDGNNINKSHYLELYLMENEKEIQHNLKCTGMYNGIKKIPYELRKLPPRSAKWHYLARKFPTAWRNAAIQCKTTDRYKTCDLEAARQLFWQENIPQHSTWIKIHQNNPRVNPTLGKKVKMEWKNHKPEPTQLKLVLVGITVCEWKGAVMANDKIEQILMCPEYIALLMKCSMTTYKFQTDPKCENTKNGTLGNSTAELPPEIYDTSTTAQTKPTTLLKAYIDARNKVENQSATVASIQTDVKNENKKTHNDTTFYIPNKPQTKIIREMITFNRTKHPKSLIKLLDTVGGAMLAASERIESFLYYYYHYQQRVTDSMWKSLGASCSKACGKASTSIEDDDSWLYAPYFLSNIFPASPNKNYIFDFKCPLFDKKYHMEVPMGYPQVMHNLRIIQKLLILMQGLEYGCRPNTKVWHEYWWLTQMEAYFTKWMIGVINHHISK